LSAYEKLAKGASPFGEHVPEPLLTIWVLFGVLIGAKLRPSALCARTYRNGSILATFHSGDQNVSCGPCQGGSFRGPARLLPAL